MPAGSAARINAPEGPALAGSATKSPELPAAPVAPSADDVFLEEDRDDAWAAKTEAEIAKRWKAIRGAKLASSECKRTQCRLVVSGAEPEVATAIADLEGPRGMHGFAENVLLTNPAKNADGTIALRIYVRFER